jgi:glyoxylase I family protein
MPIRGPLNHIDLSISDPERSIPFYAAFFEALGYRRLHYDVPAFQGDHPTRATWGIRYPGGASFAVEVRPASGENRSRRYDRYAPGPHHMAFHAEDAAAVDEVHAAMVAIGAEVLDPPTDYSEQPAYSKGYYAVFFADPDGMKLEVAHIPGTNPKADSATPPR